MRRGIYLYAVATKQWDGTWYPWSSTFAHTADGSIRAYVNTYVMWQPTSTFKVKRFRIHT